MSVVWIAFLGLVVLVAVVARVDLRVRSSLAASRTHARTVHDRNLDEIELVQRRLLVGPLPVTVRSESGLRGERLVFDLDGTRLRLHRYGGADRLRVEPPAGDRPRPALFLVRVSDTTDRGWQVVVEGPSGSATYEGWLLERREPPGGAGSGTTTDAGANGAADGPTRRPSDRSSSRRARGTAG